MKISMYQSGLHNMQQSGSISGGPSYPSLKIATDGRDFEADGKLTNIGLSPSKMMKSSYINYLDSNMAHSGFQGVQQVGMSQ